MANKQARKALKAIEIINANPELSNVKLGKLAGCTNQYISYLRKKMAHVEPESPSEPAPMCSHGYRGDEYCHPCATVEEPPLPLDLNDAPTQEELDTVLEAASVLNQDALNTMLAERGLRYGTFLKRAIIAQRLKAVMADTPNWIALNDDMAESLEMIAHKISRILGGDPAYADSWVDIAGYAQLVADRLNGKER